MVWEVQYISTRANSTYGAGVIQSAAPKQVFNLLEEALAHANGYRERMAWKVWEPIVVNTETGEFIPVFAL